MWRFDIVLIAWTVGLAGPAWAASVALHSTLELGAGYVRVVDRDFPGDPLEDVATREGLRNTLTYDNAYVHVGLAYEITAVQLRRNSDLDYLDHRLAIHVDPERWLRRVTPTGHLTIVSDLTINPSLPPLQPVTPISPAVEPGTLPADTGTGTPPVPPIPDLPGAGNALTLREDRSGYALNYGLGWEDDLTPFSSYRTAGVVSDYRYRSAAVADVATLNLTAEYLTRLQVGQAGVGVSHGRFVRGDTSNTKTYGLFASLSRSSFRTGWRIAPGVVHATDREGYGATLNLSGFIRNRALIYTGTYGIGYEFLQVGQAVLARAQSVGVSVHPRRPVRFSPEARADARFSPNTTQYTVAVTQGVAFTPRLDADVGYERALARWRTSGDPSVHQQHADSVRLMLNWQFL